jgi:polar amino acid transport system substrate-binding protein
VRLVAKSIEQATCCFEVIYGDDLPHFYGSFQRIEQVLINLLLNACQALSQRSSCLSLVTRFDGERELLQLILRDEGVGMSPEVLPKIVNPFFTTRRDTGGTGLGLSICSTIIQDHGGHMNFNSHLGEGTTVTVELPIGRQGKTL